MITHDSQDPTPRHLTREAIEQELARQNQELEQAMRGLARLGTAPLSVPRSTLEAIDQACLVRASTLTSSAIRG